MTNKRHFQSMGNEVWVLDICDKDGHSVMKWESMQPEFPWRIVDADQKAGSKALITDRPAEIRLDVPADGHLRLLKHPWSGIIEIEYAGKAIRFDLFSSEYDNLFIYLQKFDDQKHEKMNLGVQNHICLLEQKKKQSVFSEDEKNRISEIIKVHPTAIAIVHPEWIGVRKSTEELFKYILYLKDNIDEKNANRTVQLIAASRCRRIVLSGFPFRYQLLVDGIHKQKLNIRIFVIWHASFLQSNEEFNWRSFKIVHDLCKRGLISKWGFVKKGMAEDLAQTGIETGFIMNYVRSVPDRASVHKNGGPHIGLWAVAPIWRKSPYAMMAAAARIPKAKLLVVGQNDRARRFGDILGLHATYLDKPIPSDEISSVLGGMHLNLYVTLSECAPMLPLESLAAGVPCLMGPNSHYFEDHSYLYSRLVVPFPDRSDIIAQYIERALAEREQIVDAYIRYAPDYNRRAQQSLYDFLEIPTEAVI